MTDPGKVMSPSRLARFYFHECERFLRFSSVRPAERKHEGVPEPPDDPRPVTAAILESGFRWEEEVVGRILSGDVEIAGGKRGDRISDRVHDQTSARGGILSLAPGKWIYQPELLPPQSFYERFGLDSELAFWPACRPDLIQCSEENDGLVLRVVDVKASPGVKLSHRIQATLYSIVLETLLSEWGAAEQRVGTEGGIWLGHHESPDWFDLRALRPPIEQFLAHDLERLLSSPADQAPWHVYFRCEWCEWFDHCRQEMRVTDSVSRVPYLSTHAKRFLATLDPPADTITSFAELVSEPSSDETLDGCASLRGRRERLRTIVGALQTDRVRPYGGSSLAMPRGENVRLVLTAQREPVSGQLYAFGLYAQGLKDVTGAKTRTAVHVAPAGDEAVVAELERAVVRELWGVCSAVHDYNAARSGWRDRKSLQAYTFDTYERELISTTLLSRLSDPEVAHEALLLLFHFQGPDLLQAHEHPAGEVFFPAVVLTDVLRNRLALPIEVSYRFADAVRLLQPASGAFEFRDNPYFSFELSNQLRSDAIYGVWQSGETERIESIENELRARLWATNSVVNGARQCLEAEDALFAWPAKFRLPGSFDHHSPLLSRLAFLAQYEAILGYLNLRLGRMEPLVDRLRSGAAVALRYAGSDRFEVTAAPDDLELDAGGFPNYLLASRDENGQQAALTYNDYISRGRHWVARGQRLHVAAVIGVEGTPSRTLQLNTTGGPDSPELVEGREYLLCERFTDFNTREVLRELQELDNDGDRTFHALVSRPREAMAPIAVAAQVRRSALALAEGHGLTPSQIRAFERVLDRTLQLVWGPPGTGKTHFLALAILCLAEAYRAVGTAFRVLVTAFTHAAIENVLRKAAALQADHHIVRGDFALGKLGEMQRPTDMDIVTVDKFAGDGWLSDHTHGVLGGTVWALRRLETEAADLVVVDEASQMRVPESVIAVRRAAPEGRLLLAGDHRQLPPIVQGVYPEPEDGEPLLHRSIFECLAADNRDGELISTLLESFRMNRTLCRFPAEQVYVPEYDSATDEIGSRRLELDALPREWTGQILDPEYPLVVCVLEGVRATAENAVEAALVADVAEALRRHLLRGGETYPDGEEGDSAFWRDGVFVVSPHQAQLRAVRRALDKRRDWHAAPFVDTVDKMQGQECDAVVVSYGVSDVEYAMGEKEFIYSLNRLNVAITRSRVKTVAFLPRPLLEPPVAAFEDDRIAEGIGFMQGLWRFAEREGESVQIDLDNGARLSTHRVPCQTGVPVSDP